MTSCVFIAGNLFKDLASATGFALTKKQGLAANEETIIKTFHYFSLPAEVAEMANRLSHREEIIACWRKTCLFRPSLDLNKRFFS